MYVLLGPRQQVEIQNAASDVAAFFLGNRSLQLSDWLIFRLMNVPELSNQRQEQARQLLSFLMLDETIRQQTLQAVQENFPGISSL